MHVHKWNCIYRQFCLLALDMVLKPNELDSFPFFLICVTTCIRQGDSLYNSPSPSFPAWKNGSYRNRSTDVFFHTHSWPQIQAHLPTTSSTVLYVSWWSCLDQAPTPYLVVMFLFPPPCSSFSTEASIHLKHKSNHVTLLPLFPIHPIGEGGILCLGSNTAHCSHFLGTGQMRLTTAHSHTLTV